MVLATLTAPPLGVAAAQHYRWAPIRRWDVTMLHFGTTVRLGTRTGAGVTQMGV